MSQLNVMLEFLENNLDPVHLLESRNRIKATLKYEHSNCIPLTIEYPYSRFKPYTYAEAFNDTEKMMVNELITVCKAAEIKDDSVPMIRANYGVGTLPSLFGLNCRILNNNLPWVDHLGSADEIRKLLYRGIPDIRTGLGKKDFETHAYYHEQLSKYQKCREWIKIYHPDLQGPFDVAHLIWGSDIYYALYDEPELVHELMNLVTDTYIAFMKELKKTINDEEDEFNCHWGTLFRGPILLRNDSSVNLSKDMYEEFVKPYDDRILREFPGSSIHYCGRADQWVFSMMESKNLQALNFGQPPNLIFGFEFLNKIYPTAKERKIAIVDYLLPNDQLLNIKAQGIETGVSFKTVSEGMEEAQQILNYR